MSEAGRRLGGWAAALGAAVVLLWLADISGIAHLPWVARTTAATAFLAGIACLAAWALAGWAAGGARRRGLVAGTALVALALAIRFAGISHEASGHYYLDEGTYYHHATAIDGGDLLPRTFVYPHLTYYADAFTLWLAGLAPRATGSLADGLWGVTQPVDVAWVLLRSVVALLGALAVLPVFCLGRRLAGSATGLDTGLVGGAAAGLLLVLSPLFNAGSHLNTCDVPATFFAAVCLALCGRLLERESARGYLLAGAAAGLAAGAKYPAGLVALGIAAVYLRWRIARGGSSPAETAETAETPSPVRWGILWAGLAALAAFVATTPALLAYPRIALLGDKGILFGARQYSQGGWIGVMPRSHLGFYLDNLADAFGLPALLAGGIGLVLLFVRDRERRRALLWLAPFPLVFWLLITDMNMVVKRNLYPVLPAAAAYLGAGLAAWLGLGAGEDARRGIDRRGLLALRTAAGALLVACLVPPAVATVRDDVGLARTTTREEAAAWIRAHLPRGARIVKESYTPELPPEEYAISKIRFAGRLTPDELRDRGNDFLLLASDAYQRFLRPDLTVKEHQRRIGESYRTILGGWQPVAEWIPSDTRLGPILKLYRLQPLAADCLPAATLPAAGAFAADPAMRQPVPAEAGPLRYSAPGQWSLVKACLPAGSYAVAVSGRVAGEGSLRVVDGENREIARAALGERTGGRARIALPRQDKYFLYLELGKGSELAAMTVERAP